MGRLIGAVVVGYLVMLVLVFASFSLTFILIGPNLAFQPGTYDVSVTWIVLSIILGLLAAMCGGYVCRRIAGQSKAVAALAAVVAILGVASALSVVLSAPSRVEPRPADVNPRRHDEGAAIDVARSAQSGDWGRGRPARRAWWTTKWHVAVIS
jgi:hypothetical protein